MADEPKKQLRLEIAHVLFIDIVGYSRISIDDQAAAIERLNTVARSTAEFRKAESARRLLKIPSGDGMALVFYDSPEAPVGCALEISRALAGSNLPLRMGVNSGPVSGVVDVNGRANVAGEGINMAQRVMNCGDAGHILLSKRVGDDLAHFKHWRPHLHDLGECEVKHGKRLSLVNLFTNEIGNSDRPTQLDSARPVTTAPPAEISREHSRVNWWLPAAVALLLVVIGLVFFLARGRQSSKVTAQPADISDKSIAVLPFENLSSDPDNAYFADGVQEEILTRLSKIADLKVISRTSTQRFKSAPNDLREIAKQLGVAHILEGTVQKAADQVRVNVQLINAQSDSHLWADEFDRKLTDIFAVESEIATKIADTLQLKLSGAEQKAIAVRPTDNSEAHELYLRGRFYWNKWLGPDFDKSREYYEKAIQLDPTYALAYAGLADYYGFAFANGLLPPVEKWAKAEEDNAQKALELDPTLGEAYNPLAAVKLYYYRNWPEAESDFRHGLELSPNFAEMHNHYAFCLILFGRNDEAFDEMQRALSLDPLSARFGFSSGRLRFFARQYDIAIEQCRKTIELDPNLPVVHECLGNALEKKGMQKEAITEWVRALILSGENEQASILQNAYAKSGFETAVRTWAQKKLESLNAKIGRGEYVPAAEFVTACVQSGDKEQAFVWLAKAAQERNRLALELKIDPLLDPLRSDPRFEKLTNQILPLDSK